MNCNILPPAFIVYHRIFFKVVFMKKTTYIFIILISIILLAGCQQNWSMLSGKKPSNYYYTNLLAKDIKLNKITSCKAIEMNYYRELDVEGENYKKLCSFLDKVNGSSFIAVPKDLPSRPKYKLFFSSSQDKYIINVYNEKYISINPWDGSYDMDYIDISTLPNSINLYELCNFLYSL
jgi:hypothetical protein